MTFFTFNKTTFEGVFINSVIDEGSDFVSFWPDEVGDVGGTGEGGLGGKSINGGGIISFSCIILPPRLLVFSTCNAIEIPCSFLPKPWPSWNYRMFRRNSRIWIAYEEYEL